MKTALHYYDIFPKVFLINTETQVTIKPLGAHAAFSGDCQVNIQSMAHGRPDAYPLRNNQHIFPVTVDADGCIRITYTFPEEGEYKYDSADGVSKLFIDQAYAIDKMHGYMYPNMNEY